MPQHYYHRQPAQGQRPSSHAHRQARTSAYMPPGVVPRSLNETQIQPMYPGVEPHYPGFGEVEASAIVPYGQGAPGGNFMEVQLRWFPLLRYRRLLLQAVPGFR